MYSWPPLSRRAAHCRRHYKLYGNSNSRHIATFESNRPILPHTAALLKNKNTVGTPMCSNWSHRRKKKEPRKKLKCSDQTPLLPAQSEAATFRMSFLNYLYLYIYIYIKRTCIIDIYVHGHAHIYTSFYSPYFVFDQRRTLPSNKPRRQKLPAPIFSHPYKRRPSPFSPEQWLQLAMDHASRKKEKGK